MATQRDKGPTSEWDFKSTSHTTPKVSTSFSKPISGGIGSSDRYGSGRIKRDSGTGPGTSEKGFVPGGFGGQPKYGKRIGD